MVNFIRLNMLFNLSNGWSWYAYKRLGPEAIIELELEMWEDLLPPAMDLLWQLIEPEGTAIEQIKQVLNEITRINGYVPEYLEETPSSLKWEYTTCPNWNSLLQLDYEDYLAVGGKPAKVSCIHGCTKNLEMYFRKISPDLKIRHFELRPNADETCVFQVSL
ncbi:MAG: hypothetical protein C4536_01515 [Actinobacteria bacterium]|jgi:hypothetical protein|nr:MAG: hypothetical protein C4536_01515 [Actinomycetota bacterium]